MSEKEDQLVIKLNEFGASEDAIAAVKVLGALTVEDLLTLTESDFTGAGLTLVSARKLVASLKPAAIVAEPAAINNVNLDGILPTVLNDEAWLTALKAGGVLKVDQSSVISSIRAALAYKVGLYDIPKKIVSAMEEFADKNDDPVDASFFILKKQLTRKNYAEIFGAFDGMDGTYVTEKAKKKFFDRMDSSFFPAIFSFYVQLKSWHEAWMQGATNPAILMAAIANRGAALPQGMMSAPDTGMLRDQGDAVNNAINKSFAGIGIQITAALAYDAVQINKIISDPKLPSLIGAANRDQMLRQLGAAINSTYPRLETNLTKFVLATIQAKDQPSGEDEIQYFGALFMLGSQIPWDQLGISNGVTNLRGEKQL